MISILTVVPQLLMHLLQPRLDLLLDGVGMTERALKRPVTIFSDILSAKTWTYNWSWLLESGMGLGSHLRALEILCDFKSWIPHTCICIGYMKVWYHHSHDQRNKEHNHRESRTVPRTKFQSLMAFCEIMIPQTYSSGFSVTYGCHSYHTVHHSHVCGDESENKSVPLVA